MSRAWVKPLGIAALAFVIAAPVVSAQDSAQDATSAKVTGGSLSISTAPSVGNFEDVTITGADQTSEAALSAFTVSDLTGSGAGWHVTAQATAFTGTTDETNVLGAGSLKMSQPGVAASGDTDSPEPAVSTGPYTIDNGSAMTIASAALDEGMGIYDFSATTLTLSLPAEAFADTYTSTVTITVIAGPGV